MRGRVVRVCACVNMCVCRRTSEPAHDAFVRGVHPALPTGRGQGLFPVTQVHLFLFLFLFLFRISPLRDALQYLRGVLLHLSRRIVCPSLFPLSTAPLLAEASQVIRLFPVPSLSPIPATTFFFTTVAVICLFPVTSLSSIPAPTFFFTPEAGPLNFVPFLRVPRALGTLRPRRVGNLLLHRTGLRCHSLSTTTRASVCVCVCVVGVCGLVGGWVGGWGCKRGIKLGHI